MMADHTQDTGVPNLGTVRRATIASAMGNAMEWYDYGVFTAGAITSIIGSVFFPGGQNAVLKSLALVAIGFVIRPFGGLFFGPLGDKIGRRRILATTILLMSLCTFCVGILPDYRSIGLAAPLLLLLLRLLQGFSTGGEYGGAATFIAEYSPTGRRGFFGSFLEFGTLSGYVLGNAVVLIVSLGFGTAATNAWAWRIPFLIALPLGLIGLYLRTRLAETPTFQQLEASGMRPKKAPLREALVGNWRMILQLIGIVLLLNVADYMLLTTMPSYFTQNLHVGSNTATLIVVLVELLQMAVISPLGALSDRIGRKPLLLTAAIGYIVLSYPAFKMMGSGNIVLLALGFALVAALLVLILAVIGSTFPAMFPTKVRYGSFAIGYNISTALFGGTVGVVVESLIQATGNNEWPAYYLMIAGAIGLIPILLMRETARVPMSEIGDASATAERS